jgi:hypothetical protein
VDQFLVLRVCAKPPAFGLRAFSVAFYFLRALPLMWLLLMQFVYFDRSKFGRDDPNVVTPFVAGVLIWLAATLLPLQRWLGIDERHSVPDSKQFRCAACMPRMHGTRRRCASRALTGAVLRSYLSLVETVHEGCSARIGSARRGDATDTVAYHAITYGPTVPPECSAAYRKEVMDKYRLYNPPLPEIPTLLPGQRKEHGGDAAKAPLAATSKPAPPQVQVQLPCACILAVRMHCACILAVRMHCACILAVRMHCACILAVHMHYVAVHMHCVAMHMHCGAVIRQAAPPCMLSASMQLRPDIRAASIHYHAWSSGMGCAAARAVWHRCGTLLHA